jgi:hypothetical protein
LKGGITLRNLKTLLFFIASLYLGMILGCAGNGILNPAGGNLGAPQESGSQNNSSGGNGGADNPGGQEVGASSTVTNGPQVASASNSGIAWQPGNLGTSGGHTYADIVKVLLPKTKSSDQMCRNFGDADHSDFAGTKPLLILSVNKPNGILLGSDNSLTTDESGYKGFNCGSYVADESGILRWVSNDHIWVQAVYRPASPSDPGYNEEGNNFYLSLPVYLNCYEVPEGQPLPNLHRFPLCLLPEALEAQLERSGML